MSRSRRRALPDNLDPLVDTLSNVVGILVMVIALVRLEVGDAVARVARGVPAPPTPAAVEVEAEPAGEAERSEAPAPAPAESDASMAERREALRARGVHDLERAAEVLEATASELARDPAAGDAAAKAGTAAAWRGARLSDRARAALEAKVSMARASLDLARESRAHRKAYAGTLVSVPEKLVARLPDPDVLSGRESWILVRYGRVYLVDREALFDRAEQAVRRIVSDGTGRVVRPDEFDSVARYLRKADVGLGPFRWNLVTEPTLRMVLGWRTKDGGIERSRLESDPALREWLGRRDKSLDIVQFQVWNDSFETYLAARTVVEAAGFRAGWDPFDAKHEIQRGLRFGVADPDIRPLRVD